MFVSEQNLRDSKLHVAVTVLRSLSIIGVQQTLTPLTSALIMSRRARVPDLLSPRILLHSQLTGESPISVLLSRHLRTVLRDAGTPEPVARRKSCPVLKCLMVKSAALSSSAEPLRWLQPQKGSGRPNETLRLAQRKCMLISLLISLVIYKRWACRSTGKLSCYTEADTYMKVKSSQK
ncbi:hypothetical protein Q8A67_023721 [Cirrhinus molitorella]|uniref:Uncharacterized protein n=1 Tax=Cirrhinus molitorella TaxID=172907 RepID=A0AA88TL65_9TELE|nr:hypothetical protein Q8A67_023721 [Cirrhinus molitorella]